MTGNVMTELGDDMQQKATGQIQTMGCSDKDTASVHGVHTELPGCRQNLI